MCFRPPLRGAGRQIGRVAFDSHALRDFIASVAKSGDAPRRPRRPRVIRVRLPAEAPPRLSRKSRSIFGSDTAAGPALTRNRRHNGNGDDRGRAAAHLSWASSGGEAALAQARNLGNLEVARHHAALMPDAHTGFGMPIGGVLFTAGAVVPYAIGVDIGCGVQIARDNLVWEDSFTPEKLRNVLRQIQRDVRRASRRTRRPPLMRDRLLDLMGMDVPGRDPARLVGPGARASWGRSAAATTSSRSSATTRTGSTSCCTRARAISASRSATCSQARARG